MSADDQDRDGVSELELVWHDGHRRADGLLVAVHGFAEHPAAALQLGSLLDPGHAYRVCGPVAPLEVGRHKRAFYRSTHRMTPDPASLATAVDGIRGAITAAAEIAGVAVPDIVLVGMSQGAGLAAAAALGRSEMSVPRRLVLFSGRPYPDGLVDWDLGSAAGTRVFAAHGTADTLSPLPEMRAFLDKAVAAGVHVDWHTHPHGHTLDPESVAAASRWLASPPAVDGQA